MELTKDAAIELSASLWLKVVETGKTKEEILYEWGFDPMMHNCPCCEYVSNKFPRIETGSPDFYCRRYCPLKSLWPFGCVSNGALYSRYIQALGSYVPKALEIARDIAQRAAKVAKLV